MSTFPCSKCSSVFTDSSNMRRHFKSSHSEQKMYMCEQCNVFFTRSDHLRRHIQTHNRSNTKAVCGVDGCKRSFSDPDKLDAHREFHIKKLKEDVQVIQGYSVPRETVDGSVQFTCPMDGCSKKYNSYDGMTKHIKFHLDPEKIRELRKRVKIYTCEECSKTFTKKVRLKNHLEVCIIFTKNTHQKSHQSDQKTETDQPETKVVDDKLYFICPYEGCRRIYSKKSNVTMHVVRNHTKQVFFKCDDCGFQFKWRNSLKSHKCKAKT